MLNQEFSSPKNQPLTMKQIAEFLDGLFLRDHFIVNFTKEFQTRDYHGEEYIVWVEHFNPRNDSLQFFYDDGDEFSDEYASIICRPEDIASIRRI